MNRELDAATPPVRPGRTALSSALDLLRSESDEPPGPRIPPEVEELRNDPERCRGRYVLLRAVARGGMGEVWQAWDLALGRRVAIKFLLQEEDAKARARFQREANALARISHPNIAAVHDSGEWAGRPFLCMEWIEGEHLAPAASLERSVDLLHQVAEGMGEAHRQGVVHRDLKPSNILVDARGKARVVDFGLAMDPLQDVRVTGTGMMAGTLPYMAPEQLRGDHRSFDGRADVHALGVILYELMSGRRPFQADHWSGLIRKILADEPPPLEGPAGLVAICLKALEKDPADRYPSAQEFADDLAKFLDGGVVLVRPRGWRSRMRTRLRKYRSWIFGAFMTTALIAAAISWTQAKAAGRPAVPEKAREALREGSILLRDISTMNPALPGYGSELASLRKKAESCFRRALAVAPAYDEAWLELGNLLFEEDEKAEALRCLDRAVSESPGFVHARLARLSICQDDYANLCHRCGPAAPAPSPSDAEEKAKLRMRIDEDLADLRKRPGDKTGLLVSDGLLAFAEGRYEDAARKFQDYGKAVGAAPVQGLDRWLGHALFHVPGRNADALAALTRAVKTSPRDAYAWSIRGCLLTAAGRDREAVEDLSRAIDCAPTAISFRRKRAEARYNAGDYAGAVVDYTEAIRMSPDQATLHAGRASARVATGDAAGTLEDCDRAIALAAPTPWILFVRANARIQKGDSEGAVKDLDSTLRLDPGQFRALVVRGGLHGRLGNRSQAIRDLELGLKLAPPDWIDRTYHRQILDGVLRQEE